MVGGFDNDFLIASVEVLEGDAIFMFEGDRGISGDTALDPVFESIMISPWPHSLAEVQMTVSRFFHYVLAMM